MLGLLSFPDFAEAFVTDLPFPNVPDLLVKALELFAFFVGRDFDRALLRHERDFEVGVLVAGAVENGRDPLADRHVVFAPRRIEQHAIAEPGRAIRERNQKQFAILPNDSLDAPRYRYPAAEFQFCISALTKRGLLPVADRRAKSLGVAIFPLTFELFVVIGERARSCRA